jgi:hypothetical protein
VNVTTLYAIDARAEREVHSVTRNHELEFKTISKHRMINHYLPKLKICLDKLDHDLIWYKDSEDLNSIGGIVLHLIEHLNRNTSRILYLDVKFDKGIEDYFPNENKEKSILIEEIDRAFLEFISALNNQISDNVNTYNIYHLVEHTGYHLGQIVDRAQRLTGTRFQFVQNGINERH